MTERAPDYWQYAGIPTRGTEAGGSAKRLHDPLLLRRTVEDELELEAENLGAVSPTERFYNFMSSYYFLVALLFILLVLEIVTSIAVPASPGQIVVIVLLATSIAGIAVYLSTFHLNACEG